METPSVQSSGTTPHDADALDGSPIWRYMDLPRFISMLSTRQIRFTKAATFKDDPWEGFCTVKHLEMPAEGRTQSVGQALYRLGSKYSAGEYKSAPQRVYVNSWCLWRESMTMWDLYGSAGRGITVTSTPARHRRAAHFGDVRKEQCAFGCVRYHEDLESADEISRDLTQHALQSGPLWQSILDLAFQKRCAFEAENEWRAALYQPPQQTGSGVDIDCDLDELIKEIYVGPRAEPFVHAAVQAVIAEFKFQKPVKHSALLKGPR